MRHFDRRLESMVHGFLNLFMAGMLALACDLPEDRLLEVLEEDETQAADDTMERPYDSLRESLKKAIAKMRDEGLVRPNKFIDKPIDPEELIEAVKELIG